MKRTFRIEITSDNPEAEVIIQQGYATIGAMLDHAGLFHTSMVLSRQLVIDRRELGPEDE